MKQPEPKGRGAVQPQRRPPVILAAIVLVLAAALCGCSIQQTGTTTNENAAANRQYMAQLNQITGQLGDVLAEFQTAVSASDAVGMKAASTRAEKLIDSFKALDPPTSDDKSVSNLLAVKDLYVSGLEGIDAAMNDYAGIYADVAAGKLSQAEFSQKLQEVQASYDSAVEALASADEELNKLANE